LIKNLLKIERYGYYTALLKITNDEKKILSNRGNFFESPEQLQSIYHQPLILQISLLNFSSPFTFPILLRGFCIFLWLACLLSFPSDT